MVTSRDIIIKWTAYGVAAALLLFLNELLLRGVTVLGVHAFLPPLLAAVVATMEDTRPAVIFGIVFGLLCDLAIPGAFPCLYTLAFTAAALTASLMAKSVVQPGPLCSLIATALAFVYTDALNMLSLWARTGAAFRPMLLLAAEETLVSCLLLAAVYPALTFVHRKFTL